MRPVYSYIENPRPDTSQKQPFNYAITREFEGEPSHKVIALAVSEKEAALITDALNSMPYEPDAE